MADVFTKAKRSEVMSRIRSRGNRDTELAMARLLRVHGLSGWRRHVTLKIQVGNTRLLVKPDFVFRRSRLALFVDGCFWHGCPRHATWPASRAAWWRRKIMGNKRRDALVTRRLRSAGWRVLRIWEHAVQKAAGDPGQRVRLMRRIQRALG
jgi:DNA mismatch endonuclease (patch repair protein)